MRSITDRARVAVIVVPLTLSVAACGSNGGDTRGVEAPATSTDAVTTTVDASSTIAATTTSASTTVAPAAAPINALPDQPTYAVEVTEDLVYASGAVANGEIDLVANLYVPIDAPGPHPVYIHLPGGGFQDADPDNSGPARALAERGFVAASFGYRVQGDDPIPSELVGAIYDRVGGAEGGGLARAIAAAVEDGIVGMEWLLAQSEDLDLDADRLVLGGGSAGAITANHITYLADDDSFDRPAVRATVDLWGGFTLARPAEVVSGDEPPVFIVHGTEDDVVAYSFTEDLVAAADSSGLAYELYPVVGAGHGVDIARTTDEDGVTIEAHLIGWLRDVLYPTG